MLFPNCLVVVRGGGDLATGAVVRLMRAGFPVVVLEIDEPLTVRRPVAVSSAIAAGEVRIEDIVARRVESPEEAVAIASSGVAAVLVSPQLATLNPVAEVVVDARMAKRNIDTALDQAPLVVALGPGFTAGSDCHAVIESMRGPRLGRLMWEGCAAPDTGVPGSLGGAAEMRVLRAEKAGPVSWNVDFGDRVVREQVIGFVGDAPVRALTGGVVRGLIAPGFPATPGLKLGDIDPRADAETAAEVSDKALAVGGAVLEAVLIHLNRPE